MAKVVDHLENNYTNLCKVCGFISYENFNEIIKRKKKSNTIKKVLEGED